MGDGEQGRSSRRGAEAPDVGTTDLVPELRDLFSELSALPNSGPDEVCRALRVVRGVRADVFAVEAVLEALTVEDEVQA